MMLRSPEPSAREQHNPKEDNIKVVVRSRPLNAAEKAAKTPSLVHCDTDRGQVGVSMAIGSKRNNKKYNFDMVFGPYSSQAEVYSAAIRPVVEEVLLGYNCTVFAYGQTGTGKTFTMEGDVDDPEMQGMIPRAVQNIFSRLEAIDDAEFNVKVSFLELYNEELQDLLSVTDEKKLRILDDKSRMSTGVACHNLEEVMVKNTNEILEVMKVAMAKRQVGETKLNKASSRSHCIFSLTLHIRETTPEGEDLLKVGKLNLVDLAGSECIGRSGAQNARAREAGNINKSLLTLGRVISALVEKTPHIPYRDSKLTRLLQESLGGRAKTCIIATVAPSVQCLDETISTLDYASRAKTIKNKPEANQRMTKRTLIKEYAEDLERLRQELASARSKDGVYLAEDRFNEMTMQIESQSTQIEELEDALDQRHKELGELRDLFDETSQKLEDTEVKLDETEQELGQTKEDLHETKEELDRQVTLVEETRVLVSAHQKTEGELQSRTQELHLVLEEAKGDIKSLHGTVERKSNLEAQNMDASRKYKDSTLTALSGVSKEAVSFCERQLHHHAALVSSVRDLRNSHKTQTEAVMTAIKLLDAHGQENLRATGEETIPALREAIKSDMGRADTQANAHLEDVKSGLEMARLETTEPLRVILKDILLRQQQELDTHTSQVAEKLTASEKDIRSFAERQTFSLNELSKRITADAEESRHALEQQTKQVQAFVVSERARIENATDNLMQQFATMLTAFRSEAQMNLDGMLASTQATCKESVDNMLRSEMQTKKEVQIVAASVQDWCSTSAIAMADLRGSIEAESTTLNGFANEVHTKATAASSCLATHAEAMLELAKSGHAQSGAIRAETRATMEKGTSDLQSKMDSFQNILAEDTQGVVEAVQGQESSVSSWTETAETGTNANSEAISNHFGDTRTRVEALSKSCNSYVDQELVCDQDNGATPAKKPYTYAADIPRTAPHDAILEAYRAGKIQDTTDLETDSKLNRTSSSASSSSSRASHASGSSEQHQHELDEEDEDENKSVESPDKPETDSHTDRMELGEISSRVVNQQQDSSDGWATGKGKSSIAFEGAEEMENKFKDSPVISPEVIMAMKVSQLRKELSALGLSQLGKKETLQQRLIEAISN
mmetsp:Transcript_21446/g.42097  ORF Transcript_21446/g.42097 Transcript_21446/m.42097 type:complete len:1132 (-) Transcript_21446:312-3707(-)